MTSQLNGDFNDEYFEIKHDIDKRQRRWKLQRVNPAVSHNFVNCGPQTPKNGNLIFTRPPSILHSASLPGFVHRNQPTEVNQTSPNCRGQIAMTQWQVPKILKKMGFPKLYFWPLFRRLRDIIAITHHLPPGCMGKKCIGSELTGAQHQQRL